MELDPAATESETYRGYTIYYAASVRRWLVELRGEVPLDQFNAAFQARRAINVLLDGQSIQRPKREPRRGQENRARGPGHC